MWVTGERVRGDGEEVRREEERVIGKGREGVIRERRKGVTGRGRERRILEWGHE